MAGHVMSFQVCYELVMLCTYTHAEVKLTWKQDCIFRWTDGQTDINPKALTTSRQSTILASFCSGSPCSRDTLSEKYKTIQAEQIRIEIDRNHHLHEFGYINVFDFSDLCR